METSSSSLIVIEMTEESGREEMQNKLNSN